MTLRFLFRAFAVSAFQDRKSTRLNSSHGYISYAVFCLKKKNNIAALYSVASSPNPYTPSGSYVYRNASEREHTIAQSRYSATTDQSDTTVYHSYIQLRQARVWLNQINVDDMLQVEYVVYGW